MVWYFSQVEMFLVVTYGVWYLEHNYYLQILKELSTGGLDQSSQLLCHWHVLFLEWIFENSVVDYLSAWMEGGKWQEDSIGC